MILFMFMWIVMASIAFVWLLFLRPDVPPGREFAVVAAVALIVRFVPLLVYREPEGLWLTDINNYEKTANEVLHGRDIYAFGPFPHPYLPFQMYILAVCKLIADATPIPFFTAVRVPQALADAGTALLLAHAASRLWGRAEGVRTGLLYAVCPFPVLATIYHGQFDVISVFFAVSAVFVLSEANAGGSRLQSAGLLALGILQKLWPAFLIPLLLARLRAERRVEYLIVAGAVVGGAVLAYVLAFGSTPLRVYDGVEGYYSPFPTLGGPPLIIDRFLGFVPGSATVLRFEIDHGEWPAYAATLAAAAWLIYRRAPLYSSIAGVLAVLFVMVNDGAPYHYLWIVPFGLLSGQRLLVASLVAAHTASYVIIAFLGGGLIFPGIDGPGTEWLRDNGWWFFVWGWVTFAVWAAVNLTRHGSDAPEPAEARQAASAPSS